MRFNKLAVKITPKLILIPFFVFSAILSVSVLVRLLYTIDAYLRYVSLISYVMVFLVIPIVCLRYIIGQMKTKSKPIAYYFLAIFCLYFANIMIAVGFPTYYIIPEYLYAWFSVPLMLFLYSKANPSSKLNLKKFKALTALTVLLAILLPNIAVFAGQYLIVNNFDEVNDMSVKASLISSRVIGMNTLSQRFRANNDYWKFMLTGVGACGEIAMANSELMKQAGIETRRVEVSGENHAFIEAKINGEWQVIDAPAVQSREEWFENRVDSIGCVTYLCTITEDSFIELIQDYTNKTDNITIRVSRDGIPVADAQVQLKHTFVMQSGKPSETSIIQTIPSPERYFLTNENGTVSLHLGKPQFIGEFNKSELFYWVIVNSVKQNCTISSEGLGVNRSIVEVNLD